MDAFAEEEEGEGEEAEPRKSMEGLLSPPPFPAPGGGGGSGVGGHNRNAAPLPGPGYPPLDAGEPSAKACLPPSASCAATASPFSYGCGGGGGGGGAGGYYSYRVARSALKPAPMPPQPGFPEKYLEVCNVAGAAAGGEDYQARPPAEFAFYPSYGAPYPPVASYLDVSVVQAAGEARHEALLPLDPYHEPWALAAGGWSGPVCCAKEPSAAAAAAGHFWKTAFAEAVGQHPAEACTFRRGRKKRIPYSKGQLKELEKEYSSSKFITKDKRRKISAATNLSERQITIWFQNRRVKEKKVVAKVKAAGANANSTANSTSDTP